MRATNRLLNLLKKSLPEMHSRRAEALVAAVGAAIEGGEVTLTALGRSLGGKTVKHDIKRVDRLLGNSLLHQELGDIYHAIAHRIIGANKRPVILVDWTELDRSNHCALVAAVALGGRAVPIYAEVHTRDLEGNAEVQRRFLQELEAVLPAYCVPIIVTDAGFKTEWCRQVRLMEWDFVTRVRGNAEAHVDGSWQRVRDLFERADNQVRDFGECLLARTNEHSVRLVMSAKPASASHPAKIRRSTSDQKHSKAQREPWLLSTSLTTGAQQLIAIYGKRMQIEESFRDAKCARFGLGLARARSGRLRLAVLWLIFSLAAFVTIPLAIAAERSNVHRTFQANTVRTRVLSWVRLALSLLNRDGPPLRCLDLSWQSLCEAFPL